MSSISMFQEELTKLNNKILKTEKRPTSWKKNKTVSLFKKVEKIFSGNYRDTILLSSVMKFFTKSVIWNL